MITSADITDDSPRSAVIEALSQVVDPCSIATGRPISLLDMGLVEDVEIAEGEATIVLWPTSPVCMQMPLIRDAVESTVREVVGIERVRCRVDVDSEWLPSRMATHVRLELREIRRV